MRIFFVLVASKRIEALLQVYAQRGRNIVIDAGVVGMILVGVVVGEVGDFTRSFDGCRRPFEAMDGLYRERV
jgi:hypothetical protein